MGTLREVSREQWSSLAESRSVAEISGLLGCDPQAVRYHLKKLGLMARTGKAPGRPKGSAKPKSVRSEAPPEGLGLGTDWAGEFRHLLTPETLARLEAWEQRKPL